MIYTDLRKMIGQLMVCGFDGITPNKEIKELIQDYHLGGIILFVRNIGNTQDVRRLTSELQLLARQSGHERPLFICIDQENGVVRRLGTGTTVLPGAMLLGATDNPDNAYRTGVATGKEMKELGINWNLAPVVDVNNNPRNPVIGVRSYSEDPVKVGLFAREAIRGMREAGIITTLKHFPGHGDTNMDSHLDLPAVPYNLDRLENVELLPYKALLKNYADVVMTAHIRFPAIDDSGLPATLSKNIITGLLREKLEYDGVVTTDCMEMNAVKNSVGTAKGAVAAIKAGVDLVMVSHTIELQREAAETVFKAAVEGEIPQTILAKAYERVQKLKERYLSWDDIQQNISEINLESGTVKKDTQYPVFIDGFMHEELASEIYSQGVTLYRNENIIPVSNTGTERVLVIYPQGGSNSIAEDSLHSGYLAGKAIKAVYPPADELAVSGRPDDKEIFDAVQKANMYDTLIVGTLSAIQIPEQANLVRALLVLQKKLIVLAMKSPYDISCFQTVKAYIATYEHSYPALCVAARIIFGLDQARGIMPVTIL